jgi:hypothetical protein
MKLHHLFLASGAVAIAAASPAHAILATQTVGPVTFSVTGTGVSTSTIPVSFTGFNTALGTLTGVRLSNSTGGNFTGSFGGTIGIGQFVATTNNYTVTAAPFFNFNNTPSSAFSGSTVNVTITPNQLTGAFTSANATASGTYGGSTSSLATNTNALRNYFAGTPTINSYGVSWVTTADNGGGFFTNALTFEGSSLYLTYEYDDGTLPAGTPGPLPLLGAGAAFGFSRKLRRRIQSTAS